ncbi:hypothetical protein E3P78_03925 [Wallemia ichthyophaga]|nr:hypothetical protein E3P78_03925 [Wallemia ichthyophaga]
MPTPPSSSVLSTLSDEVRWLGLIIPTAMLGVLTRLALVSLTTYASPTLSPDVYPQAVGCFVIGVASSLKPSLEYIHPHQSSLKDSSMAITTGYSGSVTTYATFMLDVFKGYTYITPSYYTPRGAKGAAFDVLGQLLSTTAVSISCVQLGLGIGGTIQDFVAVRLRLPEKPLPLQTRIHSRNITALVAAVLLGVSSYAITLPLALAPSTSSLRSWVYALLFAPAGALVRHKLAQFLNGRGALPYGTLAANVLGTLLTCVGYGLVHLDGSNGGAVRCRVLHATMDGLGGAMSTVSTLAMELNGMGVSRRAAVYAAVSLATAQAVCIVVVGSIKWSERGFGVACSV